MVVVEFVLWWWRQVLVVFLKLVQIVEVDLILWQQRGVVVDGSILWRWHEVVAKDGGLI
jgi:hypothetical protein